MWPYLALAAMLCASPALGQARIDDPKCQLKVEASERDSLRATQLHAAAQGMRALADTAYGAVRNAMANLYGSSEGSASEFYYSAAEVAAAAVHFDPTPLSIGCFSPGCCGAWPTSAKGN